jgi:hypothetical protein
MNATHTTFNPMNKENAMDLSVSFGGFKSTCVEVSAMSDSGRKFLSDKVGFGAVSFTVPKSELFYLDDSICKAGLRVDWKD